MIADDAAHDDLTAQVNGATGQLMRQTAASGGPSATAPATSDGDDAAAPDGAAAAPVIPKGKSPAHFDSEAGNLVFFDLDVEVGGPNCGIIQLSAVAHDQAGNLLGQPFNEYVKPWAGARWNTDPDACCHGLSATDRRITTAEDIKVVWKNYLAWSEQFTSDTKKGVITAWNGKGCDIEWIFKTTDVTFARDPTMRQPHNTPYFWDPMKTCKYKKCKINKHLEEHGYALSEAYKAVTPGAVDLPGAHDSLVDAQAQAKIVRTVIDGAKITDLANTTQGIELLADVYKAKREKHARLLQESVRAVPAGWVESDPTKWKCPAGMNYEGGEGGPKSGPGTTTGSASANFDGLADLFSKFMPDTSAGGASSSRRSPGNVSLQMIADESNRYAQEWVVTKEYGTKKKKMLIQCESSHLGARRRAGTGDWQDFTAQSIKVYLAILIGAAAMKIRSPEHIWSTKFNAAVSWMQNAMTKRAFMLHRRFIHFVDSGTLHARGTSGHDKLGKIRPILTHYQRAFKAATSRSSAACRARSGSATSAPWAGTTGPRRPPGPTGRRRSTRRGR